MCQAKRGKHLKGIRPKEQVKTRRPASASINNFKNIKKMDCS
jgi:hypothetical protein